jgi:F0F1-type ATP synthase assembly protein I
MGLSLGSTVVGIILGWLLSGFINRMLGKAATA